MKEKQGEMEDKEEGEGGKVQTSNKTEGERGCKRKEWNKEEIKRKG